MSHGRPEVALARHIATNSSIIDRILIGPFQFAMAGIPIAALFIAGLRRSFNDKRTRAIPVGYGLLIVILMATGGKQYYAVGMIPFFIAAGACTFESILATNTLRRRRLWAGIGLNAVTAALIGLPIIPASSLASSPVAAVYPDVLESVGWPQFLRQVEQVWKTLSPTEQANAIVFTRNYGEAAALQQRALHSKPAESQIPVDRVWSTHNGYWYFGPPAPVTGPVIVIGYDKDYLDTFFQDVRPAATIDNELAINNQEQGQTIWICSGTRSPWTTIWSRLRHFD